MSNGKNTVSDKDKKSLKSRIASIKRNVVSPKYTAKEFKEQHGLSTKQFIIDENMDY